jgi:hypothetical protein
MSTATTPRGSTCARRVLADLELGTGGAALVCGALLVARPDGALLGLPREVPGNSPFTDWRAPGALLAGLVGVGHLLAGVCVRRSVAGGLTLSALAGAGLVVFEAVEARWLGRHPLQGVFAAVGVLGVTLSARATTR